MNVAELTQDAPSTLAINQPQDAQPPSRARMGRTPIPDLNGNHR